MLTIKNNIEIYSDTKYLPEVEYFLLNIFNKNKIPTTLYNSIYLCVTEAVTNAIEHGNQNDNKKKVFITSRIKKDTIKFIITDQGEGFDISEIYDPTIKENLKKEEGRGIYFIKTFAERIKFKKKGNVIEFKFKLSGEDTIL